MGFPSADDPSPIELEREVLDAVSRLDHLPHTYRDLAVAEIHRLIDALYDAAERAERHPSAPDRGGTRPNASILGERATGTVHPGIVGEEGETREPPPGAATSGAHQASANDPIPVGEVAPPFALAMAERGYGVAATEERLAYVRTRTELRQVVTGETPDPPIDTFVRVCVALGVSPVRVLQIAGHLSFTPRGGSSTGVRLRATFERLKTLGYRERDLAVRESAALVDALIAFCSEDEAVAEPETPSEALPEGGTRSRTGTSRSGG